MTKTTLAIQGMSCSHCQKAVSSLLLEIKGVRNVVVDLGNHTAEIEYNEQQTGIQKLIDSVNESGIYQAIHG